MRKQQQGISGIYYLHKTGLFPQQVGDCKVDTDSFVGESILS
jgi:hypothetical protein